MENKELVLTKESLVAQAKKAVPLFGSESIPGITIRFDKFGEKVGLFNKAQLEEDIWETLRKSWHSWTHDRDYDAKKRIFNKLGFDVVGLFVDYINFSDFDRKKHWSEDFLIQQKDLFIVDIRNNVGTYQSMDEDVIFVLEYHAKNRGEIAQATVDYQQVANDRQMQHELSNVFRNDDVRTRVDNYLDEHGIHPDDNSEK